MNQVVYQHSYINVHSAHHCKKMFCITHIVEHDQYIKKRAQDRNKLKHLLNDYVEIFDEDKIRKELKRLEMKLENYQKLHRDIGFLLFVNDSDDSMITEEKIQTAIEKVEEAIAQEQLSKPMTGKLFYLKEKKNRITID